MQTEEQKTKRIAVIFGGHGFIGSHLARKLIMSGSYTQVISADIATEPRFKTQGVVYVYCDVRNEIPADFAPGVTEIFNLAAVHTTPGHEDWEYFWTNILGATQVCEYARRTNVRKIVFTSSISVYGPSEEALTEDSTLQPNTAYGQSKLCAEKIHRLWHHEHVSDRKLVIARPAVIFGFTERGNFTRLAGALRRGAFFYAGRKDTIKACGYVKDLVESFMFFLSEPIDSITYNFAYSERFTIENICEAFQQIAGYRRPNGVIPIWLMMMVGSIFEILSRIGIRTSINRARMLKLFRSTNIVPKRLDESGFKRKFGLCEALVDWKNESGDSSFG